MKKFLIVTAIALGGVGIALGVSALLFTPASNETKVQTGGLIDDLATATPDATSKPKKSPKAADEPSSEATDAAGSGGGAPAASGEAAAGGGSGATASARPSGPSSQFVQNGVVVEASDHEDDPCADEDNEAEREACEEELEAEAEEEEEEREAEEDNSN